jgi:type IV secretory pathway TrbD component
MSETSAEISDNKIKHLEFIQGVIERMAAESARMKRFALISGAVIMSTATATNTWYLAVVGVLIWFVFWAMDAKYLTQERWFRDLYDHVRQPETPVDFSISPNAEIKDRNHLSEALVGWSIWPFYSSLIAISLLIAIAIALKVGSSVP